MIRKNVNFEGIFHELYNLSIVIIFDVGRLYDWHILRTSPCLKLKHFAHFWRTNHIENIVSVGFPLLRFNAPEGPLLLRVHSLKCKSVYINSVRFFSCWVHIIMLSYHWLLTELVSSLPHEYICILDLVRDSDALHPVEDVVV
jgi:hypothetical protein